MKALLSIILVLTSQVIFSQSIAINNNGVPPHQSTILDIQADGKGIRIPSMKSSVKPSNPTIGLMYYQINDSPGLYIYNNNQWEKVFSNASLTELWQLNSSNNSTFYNQGNVGIGIDTAIATLDVNHNPLSQDTFAFRVSSNSSPILAAAEGLSIGTYEDAPQNGLHVKGYTTLGSSNAIARLNVEPVGLLGLDGTLDAREAAIVIGSTSYGMYMDYSKIENNGDILKLNSLSDEDITLGEGGGKVGIGIEPIAKLQVNPIGNLNNNGTLATDKAALMVGNASNGLLMDNNQLESVGSTLFLNLASTENVSIGKGGGLVGIGAQLPTAKLDIFHDDWQLKLGNDNEFNVNDWYVGSTGPTWLAGEGKFLISPVSNSLNSLLTLSENGNIGLGTHDPQARVHILGGTDASLSGGSYLTIGELDNSNLAFDNNEILARNNGEKASLLLNRSGGSVGIGISSPQATLHVKREIGIDLINIESSFDIGLRMKSHGGISFGEYVEPAFGEFIINSSDFGGGYFKFSSLEGYTLETSDFEKGNIGHEDKPLLDIYSKWYYAGTPFSYLTYSDRRLKENIKDLDNALDIINRIQGVTYALKEEHFYGPSIDRDQEFTRKNQMGIIAQDLEKILPQMVHNKNGYKTVGYMGLIPVLVEAVKELSEENEEMKKLILEQSKIINRIDAQLNAKNQ